MKIGVFGGTFNPPHYGHIRLAERAAEELCLDKVIIIPSCIPPHKAAGSPTGGEERLEMCRLAFEGPLYEISDMEIRRGDRSYTVDTLRELKAVYPGDEIWFIMGSDMLETFTQWYKWEEILELACVCAASRESGYKPDLSAFSFSQRSRVHFIDAPPFEVSSTEIRRLVKSNSDTDALLPPVVREYIQSNNLYNDDFDVCRSVMARMLGERRLHHSECVSESAGLLAEKYGADLGKAKLAGLLHDITKELPAETQLELIGSVTPLERANHKVWHQMSCPAFLVKEGLTDDEEILSAVRWHTTGRAGMTLLEKIVYVADFISADRDYPDVDVVRRLADISLEHAILYTSRYTVEDLVKRDIPVHPSTLDCYNDTLAYFGL